MPTWPAESSSSSPNIVRSKTHPVCAWRLVRSRCNRSVSSGGCPRSRSDHRDSWAGQAVVDEHGTGKVGQFKSFSISGMQKTMLAGFQQRDAAILDGVMLSLGLGAVTYWARKRSPAARRSKGVGGGRPSTVRPDRMGDGCQWRAGEATRGTLGLSMITGKPISRYATRNTPGALLDPTLDAASYIFQATGAVAAGDFERSDLHTVRKLLPAQLFWLRTPFRSGGEGDRRHNAREEQLT